MIRVLVIPIKGKHLKRRKGRGELNVDIFLKIMMNVRDK